MLLNDGLRESNHIELQDYKLAEVFEASGHTEPVVSKYAFIEMAHKYINESDPFTQEIYLHHLLGKDMEDSAHILNIPESRVCRYLHTFISGFQRFAANQLKKGNIDIEATCCYIKCMKDKEMDDQKVADAFKEDMLTTKVMKHFLKHLGAIPQTVIYTLIAANAVNAFSYISMIRLSNSTARLVLQ